jgi:SMC interacting uncharacterized protein involved in chromosome segregation
MALSKKDFRNMTDDQLAEWDMSRRKAEQYDALKTQHEAVIEDMSHKLEEITRERDELRERCQTLTSSHVEVQHSGASKERDMKDQLRHLVEMYEGLTLALLNHSELRLLVNGIPRIRDGIRAGQQVIAITRAMID